MSNVEGKKNLKKTKGIGWTRGEKTGTPQEGFQLLYNVMDFKP